MVSPKYLDTLKGEIIKAISVLDLYQWGEIRDHLRLTDNQLRPMIKGLKSEGILTEGYNGFRVDYDLYLEYRAHFGDDWAQGKILELEEERKKQEELVQLSRARRQHENNAKKKRTYAEVQDRVIDDKKHRELMTKYIEYIEKDFENIKDFLIDIEKPYNYYGSRGFIDVLFSIGVSTSICELKPVIYNLGEAIRQLRRAHDAILKNAITDFKINNLIYLRLVTKFDEQNISTLKDSYPILKNIKNLIIDLYCENTNEFFFITSNSISDHMLEKYGDPLDKRWEMCITGESQLNEQGLRIV